MNTPHDRGQSKRKGSDVMKNFKTIKQRYINFKHKNKEVVAHKLKKENQIMASRIYEAKLQLSL